VNSISCFSVVLTEGDKLSRKRLLDGWRERFLRKEKKPKQEIDLLEVE